MNDDVQTYGLSLEYGTAGGAADTPLAGIRSVDSLPNLNFDEYEKTEVDQDDRIKQWVMTMIDAGMLGVTLGMSDSRLTTLYGLHDGVDRAWAINLPNGGSIAFEGPLKRIGMTSGGGNTP